MSNPAGISLKRSQFLKLFKQRQVYSPPPEIENSILLRVLVQALVVVGIVATDVAAEVAPGEIPMSLWAVPLSIAGATWSWYRRRERNIPVKFALAIGMLGAMAFFFQNLFNNLGDSRLALAQLLIQLQVLHSFDLPRRKDLGYSMVIGLILLGVAATVSQTLAFAPLLIAFLAIALPVLVLDYRSRLGISFSKNQGSLKRFQLAEDLSWRRLSVLLVLILSLGLTIFAFLPRLPGYQLRSFPVSAPPNLQDRFLTKDSKGIINPGYVRPGKEGSGSGEEGQGQGTGPGKMNDTFYYGFGSKINQNLRGELKPKVVLRVRSQAEGFWRVLAFDRYTGQGWEISRDEKLQRLNRPSWSYRFFLFWPGFIGKSREVIQSYTVVSELPNLIPALANAQELYFPTQQLELDPEGSLRSPSVLPEGLTYTVISQVPYRDRTLLGAAPTKYEANISKYYLQIPPSIAEQVRQETEKILARSPQPLANRYETALYLAQYLKQRYSIPKNFADFPFLGENEDLVAAFLFKYQGGYPDHFSTVLTVMLRSIGIPARLVAGFAPGQFNPFTGLYIVRNTDAYAMTEVYFPKYGWFTFDPIPGHPLIPPSIEEDQTFSVLQQFWKWVAGWLPSPVTGWLNWLFEGITRWLVAAMIWLWALLTNGWIGLFTGLILATGLAFLGWIGWQQWKSWRYRLWLKKLPPMESLYQQMLSTLAAQGFRKHPAQTPLEYGKAAHHHYSPPIAEAIDEISQAYVRWRYGVQKPNLSELRQRLQELKKFLVFKSQKQ